MAKKTKKATTVAEQISKMINRGVVIADTKKAEEYLLDIGYYRLGFYLHPFEEPTRNSVKSDVTE